MDEKTKAFLIALFQQLDIDRETVLNVREWPYPAQLGYETIRVATDAQIHYLSFPESLQIVGEVVVKK